MIPVMMGHDVIPVVMGHDVIDGAGCDIVDVIQKGLDDSMLQQLLCMMRQGYHTGMNEMYGDDVIPYRDG
jgi:hypothetical protein